MMYNRNLPILCHISSKPMTFHILPKLVRALIESPTIRKSRGVHRMQAYSESQILGHSKRCMTVLVSLVDVMPRHCKTEILYWLF